jgi:myosin I
MRDAMMDIIDYYGSSEVVSFVDWADKLVPDPRTGNSVRSQRLVAVTGAAVYLMERPSPPAPDRRGPAKTMPALLLRRRIPLDMLENITLSRLADDVLALHVRAQARMAQPDRTHWQEDQNVVKCTATGTPFTLFNRRHHCRVTGKIFTDAVCNYLTTLPDLGWYTPTRIFDGVIGMVSTEQLEDLLLLVDRKTEMVGIIMEAYQAKVGRALNLRFSNDITVAAGPVEALSQAPRGRVTVQTRDRATQTRVTGGPSGWTVEVPPGLDDQTIENSRKWRAKRQKELARKRKEEAALRAERQAQREVEIEAERKRRTAEKKAAKAVRPSAYVVGASARDLTKCECAVSGQARAAAAAAAASTHPGVPGKAGQGTLALMMSSSLSVDRALTTDTHPSSRGVKRKREMAWSCRRSLDIIQSNMHLMDGCMVDKMA